MDLPLPKNQLPGRSEFAGDEEVVRGRGSLSESYL
jgi:hypothetical protein